MEKFKSSEPKPKRTAEEIRRSNAELKRQLEELRASKKESPVVSGTIPKPVREQLPVKSEKSKEREKARKLSLLRRIIRTLLLGSLLLEADIVGSRLYFVVDHEIHEKSELREKEREIEKLFGKPALGNSEWLNFLAKQSKFIRETLVPETKEYPKIETIATKEGEINPDTILRYLETFPNGWIKGQVASINQTEKNYRIRNSNGQDVTPLATCNAAPGIRGTITFYEPSREDTVADVLSALSHEVSHANDWRTDSKMNYEDRVNILSEIAKRLSAKDRYKPYLFEGMKGSTPEETNYVIAVEYWAGICQQYFTDPTHLNIKDYAIVDAQVRKTDPDYNALTSSNKRAEIIKNLLAQKLQKAG